MGKYDDAMYRYLDNNERYADLFNVALFQGRQVIKGDMLEEADGRYVTEAFDMEEDKKKSRKKPGTTSRYRDLKKHLKTGGFLAITALENQEKMDYTMPFRIMELDYLQYKKQIKKLRDDKRAFVRQKGEKPNYYNTCMNETDKLKPVYTICFYHGTEVWKGPRNLKDMMTFEGAFGEWEEMFQNYGMLLFCANEVTDSTLFRTDLKDVVDVIPCRKNRKKLEEMLQQRRFEGMEPDTAKTIAVLADMPEILERADEYEKEGVFNMCKATDDWRKQLRREGKREGKLETVVSLVRNLMYTTNMTAEQAMNALLIPEKERKDYLRKL